jgi:ribosomal protein S21
LEEYRSLEVTVFHNDLEQAIRALKKKLRGKRDAGNKIRNPFDTEDHDVT